jgi:Coenzyme PQQ synthesis protein D (PqqD)
MRFPWGNIRTTSVPDAHTRWQPTTEVTSAVHGDRTVLMDLRSEQFFTLDDVGARIWKILGRSATVDEITASLVQLYDAPASEVRRDVEAFVADLSRDGLISEA